MKRIEKTMREVNKVANGKSSLMGEAVYVAKAVLLDGDETRNFEEFAENYIKNMDDEELNICYDCKNILDIQDLLLDYELVASADLIKYIKAKMEQGPDKKNKGNGRLTMAALTDYLVTVCQ